MLNKFKNYKKSVYALLLALVAFLSLHHAALAVCQENPVGSGVYRDTVSGQQCFQNPLGGTSDIPSLLVKILGYFTILAIPILAIMILYGAFIIMTSEGNAEHFKKGQKIIIYAIIGFVVIAIGGGIGYIINSVLTH